MASGSYNNLDRLIKSPGGCGEQNMIRVAPAIYVYNYKKAVGKWVPGSAAETQAIAKINKGKKCPAHCCGASNKASGAYYNHNRHPL